MFDGLWRGTSLSSPGCLVGEVPTDPWGVPGSTAPEEESGTPSDGGPTSGECDLLRVVDGRSVGSLTPEPGSQEHGARPVERVGSRGPVRATLEDRFGLLRRSVRDRVGMAS